LPSPTIKKLQTRVAELKAVNRQLKASIKQLNDEVKSLSDVRRRLELQHEAALARIAAAAQNLRSPLHVIAIIQQSFASPSQDKTSRKEAARLKRALAAISRGLDKLEGFALQAQEALGAGSRGAGPDCPRRPGRQARRQALSAPRAPVPTIYMVDDGVSLAEMLPHLQEAGYVVKTFASAANFADDYRPGGEGCIVVNALTPDVNGFELIERLLMAHPGLPAVIAIGEGDAATTPGALKAEALRAGAADFIEKPVSPPELLAAISRAVERSPEPTRTAGQRETATAKIATLSKREREVLALVIEGHPSKNIAADLGVSQRTIENHRAAIMRKMGAKSLAQLVRLVFATE
jgi:FixJ family two-component response regulator